MKGAQEYADIILADIHHDMDEDRIPRNVGSFSALHDYVDANCYVIKVMDPDWQHEHPQREGFTPVEIRAAWLKATEIIETGGAYRRRSHSESGTIEILLDVLDEDYNDHTRDDEDYTALVNQVTDLVDKALRDEVTPAWCKTCGEHIQEGKCTCWAILAGFFEQYLGMGFDSSAQAAAIAWDSASLEDKLRVWRNDYASTHFTHNDKGQLVPISVYEEPKEK